MSDNTQRIVAVLQRELVVPPEPARAEAHLEVMLLEFALAQSRDADAPAARPVKRQRGVLAAAMVVGLLTLTSGLAAAGALPPPVQHLVSRAGHVVGIELPDPEVHSGANAPPIDHRAPAIAPRRGPAEHRIDVPRAQSGAPPSLAVAGAATSPARPSARAAAYAVVAVPPTTSATQVEPDWSAPGAQDDQSQDPRDAKGPAVGKMHPKDVTGPKHTKSSKRTKPFKHVKPPKPPKHLKPPKPPKQAKAQPADSGAHGADTPHPGKSGSAPAHTRQG